MRAIALSLLVIVALSAGLFLLNMKGEGPESPEAAEQRDSVAAGGTPVVAPELAGVGASAVSERLAAGGSDSPTVAAVPDRGEGTEEVRSMRRGRVRGRITDGAGSPIPGADVTAQRGDTIWMFGADEDRASTATAVSDALGLFSLECSAGEVTVGVGADGFAPFEQTLDVPLDGEANAGDLRLAAGVTLRGRVVDSTGAGVPDAKLRRTPKSTGNMTIARLDGGDVVTETDDTGQFKVTRQAVGPFHFAVHHAGYPTADFSGVTRAANEVKGGLVVTLRPGASISGIVTGIGDEDRSGLVVRATPGAGGAGGAAMEVLELGASGAWSAKVQDDGSFTVTGVESGSMVHLELHSGPRRWNGSSRRSQRLTVAAGETGVRIAYSRGAGIVFHVTDSSGTAVEPEGVNLSTGFGPDRDLVLTDAIAGAYRIEDVWPNADETPIQFRLRAPGFEDYVVDELSLQVGADLDLGTLVLKARPQVRVTVTSAIDGAPVAGASVVIREAPQGGPVRRRVSFRAEREEGVEDGPMPNPFDRDVRGTTDEAGVCVLDATPGQTVLVEAKHPEHALAVSEPLTIAEGTPERQVELTLPAGGAIDVLVVDTLGQPAPSYPVIVRGPSEGPGRRSPSGPPDAGTTSDETGRVTITGLAAGEQWLRLGKRRKGSYMMMPRMMVSGDAQEDDYDWTPVTVVAGGTVEGTLVAPAMGSVEGKLTELGLPLAGATITIREDNDAASLGMMILGGGAPAATVDARGEFTIAEMEEGEHELVIEHPTRSMPTRWPVTVEAGSNKIEIDLKVTVVEGRVLGPDGEPLAGATVDAKRHEPSAGPRIMATMIVASDDGAGDGEGMVMSIGGEGSEPVRTDAEGRFTLRGVVADAPIVVVARADGLDETRTEPFEVAVGSVRDKVELRFQITGTLRIEIENFRPGMIAVLRKQGEFNGDPKIEMLSSETAVVEGLAPGAWTVRLSGMRPGDTVSVDPDEVEVDVVGGETRAASFVVR